jgi:DHA2 family multidrug resistance protein
MSHLSSSNFHFQDQLRGMAQSLMARGFGAAEAQQKAYALMKSTVERQATMLAYIDNFWLLGCAIAAMIPFVFLMKRPKAGEIAVH